MKNITYYCLNNNDYNSKINKSNENALNKKNNLAKNRFSAYFSLGSKEKMAFDFNENNVKRNLKKFKSQNFFYKKINEDNNTFKSRNPFEYEKKEPLQSSSKKIRYSSNNFITNYSITDSPLNYDYSNNKISTVSRVKRDSSKGYNDNISEIKSNIENIIKLNRNQSSTFKDINRTNVTIINKENINSNDMDKKNDIKEKTNNIIYPNKFLENNNIGNSNNNVDVNSHFTKILKANEYILKRNKTDVFKNYKNSKDIHSYNKSEILNINLRNNLNNSKENKDDVDSIVNVDFDYSKIKLNNYIFDYTHKKPKIILKKNNILKNSLKIENTDDISSNTRKNSDKLENEKKEHKNKYDNLLEEYNFLKKENEIIKKKNNELIIKNEELKIEINEMKN